uniref:Uncharacterized protein n=1 Tax=Pipistrellus kuhlii TaxID=59472 RepID=A0A7J7XAS5_PIPKU|nr:hypothetical protein mPipKuh1_010577 [Pipistrellus kuhlii]
MIANISKPLLCARNPRVYIFYPHSHSIIFIVQGGSLVPIVQVGNLRLPDLASLAQISWSHRRAQKGVSEDPASTPHTPGGGLRPKEEEEMHAGGRQQPSPQPSAEQGGLPANAHREHQPRSVRSHLTFSLPEPSCVPVTASFKAKSPLGATPLAIHSTCSRPPKTGLCI